MKMELLKMFTSKRKLAFLILALIALVTTDGTAQTSITNQAKKIYIKDFNWSIVVPDNFDTVSTIEMQKIRDKGKAAIEKANDAIVDDQAKIIFVFKNDQFNFLEANYQPNDSKNSAAYLQSLKEVREMLYHTFKTQMPTAKIDSTSSTEIISGLKFYKLYVTIRFPNDKVMEASIYTRLFGKRELSLNIYTLDPAKHKALLEAWRSSIFTAK